MKSFRGAAQIGIGFVRAYQLTIRPILGPRCRFIPHCSDYSIEAFERHGLFAGGWLTAKRLGRCHPWCKGGYDPVPGGDLSPSSNTTFSE